MKKKIIYQSGVEEKTKNLNPFCFVMEFKVGYMENESWGNGYVAIPPKNCLHGKDYDYIYDEYEIDAHGGLTYASSGSFLLGDRYKDWRVIGFDTKHLGDDGHMRPNERSVMAEAKSLLDRVIEVIGN